MRLVCQSSSEESAQLFSDYLYVNGIDNHLEQNAAGAWEVWVLAEEQMAAASERLAWYQAHPASPELADIPREAAKLRRQAGKEEQRARKRIRGRDELLARPSGKLTLALILVSVLVAVITRMGQDGTIARYFMISAFPVEFHLPEVRHGQVWRLVTPIFLHFGLLHLVFNLLWLRDLGGMIERAQGWWSLARFVLVIAAASNLAQYAVSGPLFGGMSGVVYGLLGYVWMRGRHDLGSHLYLHPSTVTMMLVWFVICLVGFMPIANTVHAVGLGAGVLWGYLAARRAR